MKEAGTAHWDSPNTGATNESGFSALPTSSRAIDGDFGDLGELTGFWSSTEHDTDLVWCRGLQVNFSEVHHYLNYKRYGYSLRCVRD